MGALLLAIMLVLLAGGVWIAMASRAASHSCGISSRLRAGREPRRHESRRAIS